ncbi:MAG: hypothetical protein ACLPGW_16115 [Roseiarcus sp.]
MGNAPALVLAYNPAGPQFAISEQCVMPAITATATLQNITPDPRIPLQFLWTVSLAFIGGVGGAAHCPHSASTRTQHPDITQTTLSNRLTIPFTQVRGGDLTISVAVRVGNTVLTAKSANLQVVGTNPSMASLQAVAPNEAGFRKLMRLESGLRQFLPMGWPLFSQDNLGGVGLCQITNPPPSADQIWSWKANLAAGAALYRSKQSIARRYPERVRNGDAPADLGSGATFQALVQAYNAPRQAAKLSPVPIDLPDYDAEQLERDTLRGFNGYAGGLHEYRVKLDENGLLAVTLDAAGARGAAEWELVTAQMRRDYYDSINLTRRGDPNYVDDVERQQSF